MDVSLLKKLSSFIMKRNAYCFYSKYQIQKNDSFCASYCLYIILSTKLLGYDFKPTVLNFSYQRFSERYHLYIQLHEYYYLYF